MTMDIASPGNDQVKRLVRLQNRGHRDSERVFTVEEARVFARALAAGQKPAEVYWCPDLCPAPAGFDGPLTTMSVAAANRASYRSSSTGLLAIFPYFETDLTKLDIPLAPLLMVAEGMEKPGNLGAFLRIADAAAADGVIVVGPAVDPFNPNVVRASTGALFGVPLGSAESVGEVATWLRARGISSVASSPAGAASLWETDLTGPKAIWVGSEAGGLSAPARKIADLEVSIPMLGAVDSLNVSVAAAILLYECRRQRLQVV